MTPDMGNNPYVILVMAAAAWTWFGIQTWRKR